MKTTKKGSRAGSPMIIYEKYCVVHFEHKLVAKQPHLLEIRRKFKKKNISKSEKKFSIFVDIGKAQTSKQKQLFKC